MDKKDYINLGILTIIGSIIICVTLGFNNMYGSMTDWNSQHWAFAEYFRTIFYHTYDLLPNFAFNIGGGQNIYNFAYYGFLSPIILLSYFFSFIKMIDYIMIVSILSVFVSVFLFYKWMRNNDFSTKITMITSCLFLLAGPLIFHSHRHIMFVNYIPFLILGLMGVDRYFTRKKSWLIVISVFLMIMTSYYYSVGGIFVIVIYGIYKYLKLNEEINFKKFIVDGLKFLIPIITGILMAGVLLLPIIAVILNGRDGMESSKTLIGNLVYVNLNVETLLYSTYSLGFTAIAFIALINGFFTKKKEQLFLVIITSLFLFIPIFMYLLNGTLYIRPKVLIPFLPIIGLIIGMFLKNIFNKRVPIWLLLFVLLILNIFIYGNNYHNNFYYLDLIVTLIVIIIYKFISKDYIVYIPIIIIAFISAYLGNQDDILLTKKLYQKQFDPVKEELILEAIKKDTSFYRFNNLTETLATVNKIYHPNYYQTSLYSSTYNNGYNHFFFDTYSNAIPYRNRVITPQSNNIMFQTLMGVKYLVTDNNPPIGYNLIDQKGNIGLYKNNHVLPLGYATNNIMSYDDYSELKYPYNIDALLNNAVVDNKSSNVLQSQIKKIDIENIEALVSNLNTSKEENIYVIMAESEDNYIEIPLQEKVQNQLMFIKFNVLESPSCKDGDISIDINGITNKLTCKSWMYHNQNYQFEYTISSPSDIDKLIIKFSKGEFKISDIETYVMDYDNVIQAVNRVDKMTVDMKKTIGDKIVGQIDVKHDGYFVTTIPYDKGFEIKLNNIDQEYEKVNDAFIGFPIKKGTYNIEIKYKSPLFNVGLFSSIIGFIVLTIIIIMDKKKQK